MNQPTDQLTGPSEKYEGPELKIVLDALSEMQDRPTDRLTGVPTYTEEPGSNSFIIENDDEPEHPAEKLIFNCEGRPKFVNNRWLHFVYKGHLKKDLLQEELENIVGFKLKFFRAAHETADKKHPYLHTHAITDFGKTYQTRDVRKFDLDGIPHPYVGYVKSLAHFRNVKKYLAKEDPENKDLLEDEIPLMDNIWMCETKQEALRKFAKTPAHVSGVSQAYDNKPQEKEEINLREWAQRWQQEMLDRLEKIENYEKKIPTDEDRFGDTPFEFPKGLDRKIIVLHDPAGGNGKSLFAKTTTLANPKKYLAITEVGQARDMATVILGALQRGWSGDTLIVDLTRSKADHQIMNALEQMRNGQMTTIKYEGRPFTFKIMNMLILTNWMPDLCKMTWDRWEIYGINKISKKLYKISYDEGIEIRNKEIGNRMEGLGLNNKDMLKY